MSYMGDRSISQDPSLEKEFPPNMVELLKLLEGWAESKKEWEEIGIICMALLNPDEDDEESMNNEDAPFEEVFDMPLIDDTLEFAKKVQNVKAVTDYLWNIRKCDGDEE